MWVPQKSLLLPWVLSPRGLIGNYIHSMATRLPCSHPLLTEFQDPSFSHSAGHFAEDVSCPNDTARVPQAAASAPSCSPYFIVFRHGPERDHALFSHAPHNCSHHACTRLLSPIQQVLSRDGARPLSQQTSETLAPL